MARRSPTNPEETDVSLPVNAEPLPSSYTFGKVVGRVIHLIADTAEDTDDKPQARAAKGTVTFNPKDVLRKTEEADYTAIVMHAKETANLSSSGRVLDAEGRQGIWLAVGVYSVRFDIVGASAPIPSFEINVTAAHTDEAPLDLAREAPYVAPTGTVVQTVIVPSGGSAGQVLARTANGGAAWVSLPDEPDLSGKADLQDGRVPEGQLPARLAESALRGAFEARVDRTGASAGQVPVLQADSTLAFGTVAGGSGEGVTEHGALTGLADDDHPQYRDRAGHTGTQAAATISDLTETVQDIVGALIVAGTGTTVSYDDVANTFTINATGGTGGTTDPEIVRDVIGTALVAGAGIQLTVNDAGDTITVASTAVLPTRQVATTGALTGGGDLSANRTLTVRAATDALTGVVELATTTETTTGTDTARAVTPAGVKAALDARPAGGLSAGVTLRAIYDGTNYIDRTDGTTITAATDRPTGTYFVFLGGPDPNALGLMVDGDEWKDAV